MVKGDRTLVALNVENDRLIALAAGVAPSGVKITSWLTVARPADVDGADAAAVGRWIGGELKSAGMHRAAKTGGIVIAVPRGEVVLKRIGFPGGGAGDLPGMVRLQMMRQLTVSPESAAIDYVPVQSPAVAGKVPAAGTPVAVLAGALQGDRLEWRIAAARAAGVKIGRIGLRSAGAAALLLEAAQRRAGPTLGIAIGSGSTEFVVVEDGQLAFARATDLYRPEAPDAERAAEFAQRVAVEAKRTWMSYRVSPDSCEIEAVTVLGVDHVSKMIAAQCGEMLGLAADAADYPGFIATPGTMTPEERSELAPLVGLLTEHALSRPVLDFAHPRRAPDIAATKRQRVLLAALALIVLGGGAYTAAKLDLQRRQRTLDALVDQWDESTREYNAYLRARARLEHLETLSRAKVDWVGHLAELAGKLPGPEAAVLDRLSGEARTEARFVLPERARKFLDGAWSPGVSATFELSGVVKQRRTADELRAALVADERYRVESKGPDTAERFDLSLTTQRGAPGKKGGASDRASPGQGAGA